MAFENSAGINVHNHYGPRDTGNSAGVERSTDGIHQLSVDIGLNQLTDSFVPPVIIPQGARFLRAILRVDEDFAGATTVDVGKQGDEATDGVSLAAATLTEGTYDVSTDLAGEWAVASAKGLTTSHKVGVAVTGTPTAGKGTVVFEFVYKNRKEPTA